MFLELSDLFNKFPLWAGTSTLPNIREKRAFDLYKMSCSDFFSVLMVETYTKICHKMRTKTPTNSPSLEYSYTITPQTQVRCSSEGTETVAHAPKS